MVTQGRLANPHKADEFVLDSGTARLFGYHLGETVTIGWVSNTQGDNSLNFKVPRSQQIKMKLVGVGAVDVDGLFQDQDSAGSNQIELFTPAFARKILECCSNDMLSAITLQGGVLEPLLPEGRIRAPRRACPRVCPSLTSRPPISWRGPSERSSRSPSPWPSSVASPAWPRSSLPVR